MSNIFLLIIANLFIDYFFSGYIFVSSILQRPWQLIRLGKKKKTLVTVRKNL